MCAASHEHVGPTKGVADHEQLLVKVRDEHRTLVLLAYKHEQGMLSERENNNTETLVHD